MSDVVRNEMRQAQRAMHGCCFLISLAVLSHLLLLLVVVGGQETLWNDAPQDERICIPSTVLFPVVATCLVNRGCWRVPQYQSSLTNSNLASSIELVESGNHGFPDTGSTLANCLLYSMYTWQSYPPDRSQPQQLVGIMMNADASVQQCFWLPTSRFGVPTTAYSINGPAQCHHKCKENICIEWSPPLNLTDRETRGRTCIRYEDCGDVDAIHVYEVVVPQPRFAPDIDYGPFKPLYYGPKSQVTPSPPSSGDMSSVQQGYTSNPQPSYSSSTQQSYSSSAQQGYSSSAQQGNSPSVQQPLDEGVTWAILICTVLVIAIVAVFIVFLIHYCCGFIHMVARGILPQTQPHPSQQLQFAMGGHSHDSVADLEVSDSHSGTLASPPLRHLNCIEMEVGHEGVPHDVPRNDIEIDMASEGVSQVPHDDVDKRSTMELSIIRNLSQE